MCVCVCVCQWYMEEYDDMKGTLDDYSELAIQFGYMTFFIAAFPAAAFFAIVNNYFEIRSDAYRMLSQLRRPTPLSAETVGAWLPIFQLMAGICVVVNAALLSFTMTTLEMYSITTRMWFFIGFQWTCFTAQALLQVLIPDEGPEIKIQVQRQNFYIDKLIEHIRDDPEDEGGDAVAAPVGAAKVALNRFKVHLAAPAGLAGKE